MFSECLSFDYVMTTGQCRLYDVKAGYLKTDDEPGCLVYAVVRDSKNKTKPHLQLF